MPTAGLGLQVELADSFWDPRPSANAQLFRGKSSVTPLSSSGTQGTVFSSVNYANFRPLVLYIFDGRQRLPCQRLVWLANINITGMENMGAAE